MSGSDKVFCLMLALIIGGCVSDKAIERWYEVEMTKMEISK